MASAPTGNSTTGATASQAWAILKRHARDEIARLRLQELCRDNDRVSSLVSVYNASPDRMLLVDLSRQRITLETLNHLLRLATARNIKKFITRLAWGQNDPDNPVIPSRLRTTQQRQPNQHHPDRKATRFQEADEGAGRSSSRRRDLEQSSPLHEPLPSFHLSLRVPNNNDGLEMLNADGTNALTPIHRDWERIQRISELVRRGQLPGITGSMIRDVVVVGRGVSIMALRFVYLALCKDQTANVGRRAGVKAGQQRRIKFLTSLDPVRAAAVVADLDPASTLVVSISISGNEETTIATKTMRSWLLQSLGNHGRRHEIILSKHMILVTGNEHVAKANKPESVFLIPELCRCEPFTTFTAATLLPLSIVFGWPIAEQFIAGAHDMDSHFVDTNPRHNLPVLLALTDIWNDSFLGTNGRIITPFTEAFAAYPAFCATLEAQTCGDVSSSSSPYKSACSSLVIDGGLHNAYDRALYQTGRIIPSEMVMTMDTQVSFNAASTLGIHNMNGVHATQDELICSMFAHADELAFGSDHHVANKPPSASLGQPTTAVLDSTHGNNTNEADDISDGNRPSTLLVCGICDAYTCGQLVALAEHRAVVKARIWNVNPFSKEVGSSLRSKRTEALKDRLQNMFGQDEEDEDAGENDEGVNLSTKTILRHYANMLKDQRTHATNG